MTRLRWHIRIRGAVLGLSLLALAAATLGAQARRFHEVSWRRVGGVPADSPDLLDPIYLAALDSLVVVYDLGDFSVKAFGLDGALQWRFGRRGKGPGEFESVTDMQADPRGRLWLADAGTARITVLSRAGKPERLIPLDNTVWNVLPARADSFFAKQPLRTPWLDVFAPNGQRARHLPVPGPLLGLDYNQAVYSAGLNGSYTAVIALRWASMFFVLELANGELRQYEGFDRLPPARAVAERITIRGKTVVGHRIDPKARAIYESVAVDGRHAYLLIGGAAAPARRIVDRHRLLDGGYAGSLLLPAPAAGLAWGAAGLVVLVTDPVPRVDVLQQVAAP
ncbi:MAG TPA: hypothetical protein VNJ71_02510 [Gemmatimonadales bacterium]|jgi:hypothetical protein|nr:hypothetical protein [Gemmatimonadales bacterium]